MAVLLSRQVLPLVLCCTAAFSLTRVQWQAELEPNLQWRITLHNAVLRNQADTPYQQHMFVLSQAAALAESQLGIPLAWAFIAIQGIGYLFGLLAVWYFVRGLGVGPGACAAAVMTWTAYAGLLLQYSAVQPADSFAAGFMAMALGLAARDRIPGLLGTSLVAGVFSLKQVLIAPALAVAYAAQRRWNRILIAATAGLLAAAGMVVFRIWLGPKHHPGVVTAEQWLSDLPKAVLYHVGFAAVPLLALVQLRGRVHSAVLAALIVYPLLIASYTAQGMFIYELRSFWVAVPAFAAVVAVWVDAGGNGVSAARASDA